MGVHLWLGFVTAAWVESIPGNIYTFSNYLYALKSLMALTQLQLNNLSVAKDVGKALGLLAGIASNRLSTPVILLIGSVEGLVGYGVQWLVVSQKIQPLPYWQMCIFMCMGANSTTWMNTAVIVTCMRNFRENRGPVSGILIGYNELSTTIFTDLCSALFSDSPSSFLLMLSIVPFLVCLAAMLFLREADLADADDKDEERYFCVFNTIASVIAVYLFFFDVTGEHGRSVSCAFAVVLLVLMAVPVAVPIYAGWKAKRVTEEIGDEEIRERLLGEGGEEEEEKEGGSVGEEEAKRRGPVIGEDHTIVEAFSTVDFWILFVSFLCGVGTGLAVMNNMGQMGYKDVSKLVKLRRIFGFFGRIGSGSNSDSFINVCRKEKRTNTRRTIQQSPGASEDDVVAEVDEEGAEGADEEKSEEASQGRKSVTRRPLWNAASQILMAVGYVIMAMALPGSLCIGSIIAGVCYGVRLAVTVPMASELFGLKYYGLIYNILMLNLPLGSFLFSRLLAGFLYDAQATRTHGGGNTCVGAHCYRLFFVIMALVCIVGLGLDLVLVLRTKILMKASTKAEAIKS